MKREQDIIDEVMGPLPPWAEWLVIACVVLVLLAELL